MSDDEKSLRELLARAEQSPLVHEVVRMLNFLEGENPERLRKWDFLFRGRDEMWKQAGQFENLVRVVNVEIARLGQINTSSMQGKLSHRRKLSAIAVAIGYLVHLSKRSEHNLNHERSPLPTLPVDFSERYEKLLRKVIQGITEDAQNRPSPQKDFGELVKSYRGIVADPTTLDEKIKEAADNSTKLTSTDVLGKFASADAGFGFGWRSLKTGHIDRDSIPGKRSTPASGHLENVDKSLPVLIGVVQSNVLDSESGAVLKAETENLLRKRLDMESYIRALKAEAKLSWSDTEQEFLDACRKNSSQSPVLSEIVRNLEGVLGRTPEDFVRFHDDLFVLGDGQESATDFLNRMEGEIERLIARRDTKGAEEFAATLNRLAAGFSRQMIHHLRERLDGSLPPTVNQRYDQLLRELTGLVSKESL